jgi:hypothetical protein
MYSTIPCFGRITEFFSADDVGEMEVVCRCGSTVKLRTVLACKVYNEKEKKFFVYALCNLDCYLFHIQFGCNQ